MNNTRGKTMAKLSNNAVYINEHDAEALGIVFGEQQKVFVDGREVELVFVDEYEVLPEPAFKEEIKKEVNARTKKMKEEALLKNREVAESAERRIKSKAEKKYIKMKNTSGVAKGDANYSGADIFTYEEIKIIESIVNNTPPKKVAPTTKVTETTKPAVKKSAAKKSKPKAISGKAAKK